MNNQNEKFKLLENRIAYLMTQKHLTQKKLAEIAGVSPASVFGWQNGLSKSLRSEIALKIANKLKISTSWLVAGEGDMEDSNIKVVDDDEILDNDDYITLKESAITLSCGPGCEPTYDEINDSTPVIYKRSWFQNRKINPKNCRFFKIAGSSMEPLLFQGDKVLVDLNDTDISNGRVYALIQDSELKVKRLYKLIDGSIVVHSDNTVSNPDVKISKDDINTFFKIIGRVVDKCGDGGL